MTVDENAHLFLGYSFSTLQDYRQGPGMGNWGQRWATLPLLFDRTVHYPKITLDSFSWLESEKYAVDFVFNSGNDPHRLSLIGRTMIVAVSIITALSVFVWVKILSGTVSGLIALAIYCLSPTLLAHSQLITADLIVSLFILLSIGTFWWVLHTVHVSSLLCSSVAIAGMLLTKYTGLIGLLSLAVILLGKLIVGRPLRVALAGISVSIQTRKRQLGPLLCVIAIQAMIVYVIIWGSYGFRYESYNSKGSPAYQSEMNWEQHLSGSGSLEPTIRTLRDWRVLPEAYIYGFALNMNYSTGKRIAFLDGEYSIEGFRRYFPLTFWYKTSLAFLVLTSTVLSLLLLKVVRNRGTTEGGSRNECNGMLYQLLPLVLFIAIYTGTAIQSQVNIGHRHILPLYPALIVCVGMVMPLILQYGRIARVAIAGALLALLIESLVAWPNYLSYFNAIAGGPSSGYKHLVDSSVDWGQDLPALRRWLDERGLNGSVHSKVFLAYYGTSPPQAYSIDVTEVSAIAHQIKDFPLVLTPGTFIVSATMLQKPYGLFPGKWNPVYEDAYQQLRHGVFQTIRTGQQLDQEQEFLFFNYNKARIARLFSFLRQREPDDRIGNSLLVFNVDRKSLDRALDGEPVQLHSGHGIRGLRAFPVTAKMIATP